jgi:hypothetical protein
MKSMRKQAVNLIDTARHPGEGRDLWLKWAPAFAGVAKLERLGTGALT